MMRNAPCPCGWIVPADEVPSAQVIVATYSEAGLRVPVSASCKVATAQKLRLGGAHRGEVQAQPGAGDGDGSCLPWRSHFQGR